MLARCRQSRVDGCCNNLSMIAACDEKSGGFTLIESSPINLDRGFLKSVIPAVARIGPRPTRAILLATAESRGMGPVMRRIGFRSSVRDVGKSVFVREVAAGLL